MKRAKQIGIRFSQWERSKMIPRALDLPEEELLPLLSAAIRNWDLLRGVPCWAATRPGRPRAGRARRLRARRSRARASAGALFIPSFDRVRETRFVIRISFCQFSRRMPGARTTRSCFPSRACREASRRVGSLGKADVAHDGELVGGRGGLGSAARSHRNGITPAGRGVRVVGGG